MLVVHVIRDTDFGNDGRVISHVLFAFLSNGRELISEAVPDRGLADLNSKGWRKVSSAKNAKDVDVPVPVPNDFS